MTKYEIKRLEDRIRELWNEKEGLLKENAELKKENEQERKLNAEIKARFVKCNTCTDEMKDKCLMFSENLCEGERCEELVDLMALVSQNDLQKENEQLKQQIEKMKCGGNCEHEYWINTGGCYDQKCKFTGLDCTNCKDKWEMK